MKKNVVHMNRMEREKKKETKKHICFREKKKRTILQEKYLQ